MVGLHNAVGTLVLLAYLANTVLHVMAMSGRPVAFGRWVAAAASALLIQYLLGFGLLGSDDDVPAAHYVVALLTIATVGAEHGFAPRRPTPREQAMVAAAASALTLALVITAYVIGSSS